jgi:hypothetical protein
MQTQEGSHLRLPLPPQTTVLSRASQYSLRHLSGHANHLSLGLVHLTLAEIEINFRQVSKALVLLYSSTNNTYHSRFIPERVAEGIQIFLRYTHVLPKLVSYEEHCRRDRW